jgi:phosphoribosylanthranilate isomerase
MIRVKFCGITNIDDALKACELGVDALGFVFAKSKRQISPEKAAEIIEKLPPLISTVGVFVDEDIDIVKDIKEKCRLDYIQLHGDETSDYCRLLNGKIIKTIKNNIETISYYEVSCILLDTYVPGVSGGTGKVYDWSLALKAKKYNKPIILAGGLTPENVAEAVRKVKPYGVDVSSGIEKSPGEKNYKKMKEFMKRVREGKLYETK